MAGRRIDIEGVVQGVGFRPWVARAARSCGIAGSVHNHGAGVSIHAAGTEEALDRFLAVLQAEAPAAARIERVRWWPAQVEAADFAIAPSEGGARRVAVPPDLAICAECLAEIEDPDARRHRYAFTSCTACGPRYTIATEAPWDRARTTMAAFPLCAACAAEYGDPDDRRHHAEPIACPACGPRLLLLDAAGAPIEARDPIAGAAAVLAGGGIVAVKGLGGFHLACDAADDAVVRRLRLRKRREAKPFAVMCPDLDWIARLAEPSDEEWLLLRGPERPIVLVRRRDDAPVAAIVAPDSDRLGLFLPYTPLHHLLLGAVGRPLVMTSGNRSDEPIAIENAEAVRRLRGVADRFLVHDRAIAARCDDSVVRAIDGAPTILRRARGFVPRPIRLDPPVAVPILGCGAQLKSTFCLAVGDQAVLGPHLGDLDRLETLAAFEEGVERLERFLGVRAEIVAHDLHPDYLSTRWAERRGGARFGVQHHHAHAAAALAEHGLPRALALCWDGTGFGTDGAAWGGELLLAARGGFERLATFRPVPLVGGERAIREPWRIALALLDDAWPGAPVERLLGVEAAAIERVRAAAAAGIHAPAAHGVGRYFDAAAVLVLGRPRARFEADLAMALEAAVDPLERGDLPFAVRTELPVWEIDLRPAVRALAEQVLAGVPRRSLAARWHRTLVAAGAAVLHLASARHGRLPIVATGGCFQNARLAEGLRRAMGRRLLLHREVPPGDGGIALGQVAVAAALARNAA